MKISFRTVFWGTAAAIVVLMLVLAFRPRPVPVDLGEVTRGAMQVEVRDEGRTRIRDVYAVAAPVGGRLLRVSAEAGDRVEARDAVARLLPSEPAFLDARTEAEARAAVDLAEAGLAAARADAESAEAALELAASEHARVRSLRDNDIASPAALDRAASELRAARAANNRARASVNMRRAEVEAARGRLLEPHGEDGASNGAVLDIRAPIGGVVLRVLQESETPLAPGTVVMEIGDPGDLEVVAELLSTDAVQVEPGAPARITDWGSDAEALPARVRRVEPYGFLKVSALGVEEQRVNVILDFEAAQADWARLGHGYRIEAAIAVWQAEDVVQVPVAALFRDDGRWAVYRVEEGRAHLTPLEIGHDNGETAQVLGGIEPGTSIVLYPGAGIADGVRVEVREID